MAAQPGFLIAPMPTLEAVLKETPPSLGFNVEIKYPIKEEREQEDLQPTELNAYTDAILQCIFDHAGDRRIFFSTFHPELARMVRKNALGCHSTTPPHPRSFFVHAPYA